LQELPHLSIERGERLIEQNHSRPRRQRARNRTTLPHSAGELVRVRMTKATKVHETKQLFDALASRFAINLCDFEGKRDVLLEREPRKERCILENDGAIGGWAVDHLPIEEDATLGRQNEPGEKVQDRRFSATRRADQTKRFTRRDVQRHIVQNVLLRPIFERNTL
jgi:hypothetical protein